jgi:HD domain-containing protein
VLGEIGTLAWTRRTNGLLSRPERARYIAATLREQARHSPRLLTWRLGRDGKGDIGEESLRIPDSTEAREALEVAKEVQTPSLVEHSLRSFVYARALGAINRLDHDPEPLFVAAVLHDHGVVETTDRCFTLAGAEEAERLGGATAAEAVTLHINPNVPPEQGPEAHLLHDGVLLDIVGLRAWELRRDAIESVRARHPRLRFTQEAGRLLSEQAGALPKCRTAAAMRAGFGVTLKLAPWRD